MERAEIFWNWFTKNQDKYLFLSDVNFDEKEELMDELLVELHKYNENLFYEIGGHPKDEKVEFIISAEGNKDYFFAVEDLTTKAPQYDRWEIIAFKPPMGDGFKIELGDLIFDPNKIIFIPLINKNNPTIIGINVCYDNYTDEKENKLMMGTYLILDSILGEKSAALDIDFIEVIKTPDDIIEYNFRILEEIGDYIEEKKNDFEKK